MNARENPFATDRTQRILTFRPEWANTSMSELTAQWEKLNRRAEILGKHGSGKSTLLTSWEQWLAENNQPVIHIFLNREHRNISGSQWQQLTESQGKIILLDGEEQLSWRQRRKFYQLSTNAHGLLITRHKSGSLPTLCNLDPNIQILHHCIKEVSPENYQELAPHLPEWWKKYQGNIREILLECYDFYKNRKVI